MSLQGTIDTMSVAELMGWIAGRKHSGILEFKRAAIAKKVDIDSGKVVNATSNDAREYFGQFLINFGLITEDQLQKAFETQKETGVLLGKILVMTGLVTEEQVLKMLEMKIRETFLDLYLWDEGAFDFQDGPLPDEASDVSVTLDLVQLNTEGVNRQAMQKEIRKAIPDNSCTFWCIEKTGRSRPDKRSSAGVMLDLARQGLSAEDIILRFHSMDFPILHTLHDLVRRGWLAVSRPADQPQPTSEMEDTEVDVTGEAHQEDATGVDLYLLATRKAVRQRKFEQAIEILKKGLAEYPNHSGLIEMFGTAERGLVDLLRSDLLADAKIPFLTRKDAVSGKKWTPAQRYILSRIDGQRHLRSIIMVSPLKEVDALRTFKALLKAGTVGLK